MKNNILIAFLFGCLMTSSNYAQTTNDVIPAKKIIKVVFYNVENLFDTIDDPKTNDKEFLPDAEVPWNSERYNTKLDKLSQVLTSVDSENFPALIGMAEVENYGVLSDLINNTSMKKGKYRIIHRDSPDERGIDVAMIYRKKSFKPLDQQFIRINFPGDPNDRTRDILYVKGIVKKKDTLHCFVNHWPSRWGGKEKSEPKRMYVARVLRSKVDSIFSKDLMANIVIVGDFNDEPADKSIAKVLKANKISKAAYPGMLYNLMYSEFLKGNGSYYYWRDKRWNMLDQVIVSGSLLSNDNALRVLGMTGNIYKEDFLMFENSEGVKQPNRTKGKDYYGGYSDHLPVFIDLITK